MRILAFDTSTEWCSVALGDGPTWHVRDEHAGQRHSERLLPMIEAMLADAGWTLTQLDAVAFGAGPGSFTGIRIACGVAQGLAFGAALPVVPIPTLAAIAQDAFRERGWRHVVACIDARMREIYIAAYERAGDAWREAILPSVMPPAEVLRSMLDRHDWRGGGNGFGVYPAVASQLDLVEVAPALRPTARAIGELALPSVGPGKGLTAADALPLYVRHRVALTADEVKAGIRL